MVLDLIFNGSDGDLEKLVGSHIIPKIPIEERENAKIEISGLIKDYAGREVDVINVLMHAADRGKVKEYSKKLKKFYESDLQYVHPEARRHHSIPGALRAESFVLSLYKEMGIQPKP